MSRPTHEDRYAQANKWMVEALGSTMPAYLTERAEVPITRAVKDVAAVLSKSGTRELLDEWRQEDALSNAGVKPIISVGGALGLLLLHMRLGRVPHIVAMTGTLHSLNEASREALGLSHQVDQVKSYDRTWAALQRLIGLVDEFYVPTGAPRARQVILTGPEYKTVLEMRDQERCQRNRARMHELANMLVEGSVRLVPAELLDRWEGNFAGDATVVAMLGKAGNPNSKDTTRKRRSINVDAGYYRRGGDHAGYTMEDEKRVQTDGKKASGSSRSKLLWGIEAEVARMTRNTDEQKGEFPLLTVAVGFHIPGTLSGAGAAMATSIRKRGHPINYCIFDRAYPGGYVRDFHVPIRLLGGKLVFDYDATDFGVKAHDPRGFVQIVGSWYLDNLPDVLREIDKPMVDLRAKAKIPLHDIADAKKRLAKAQAALDRREGRNSPDMLTDALKRLTTAKSELADLRRTHRGLINRLDKAEVHYAKQMAEREKFRLRPKGRMDGDGSRRYLVPDTSNALVATRQRFTGKTVTIDADITADKNPGGLKHEQHLTYGTPVWHHVYGLRNSVESVNRNYKRAQFEDLQNADRRHVRGNTFTYVVAAFAAVCENLRKLLSFLKDRLAVSRMTAKNADVSSVFWEPAVEVDEVLPTIRC